ncbi:mechanosensitive ion channel domain-containing protein [Indioceanicola profundi]|uniref:mechanosensitive ion channel domain-containing protein n=1 Tax=Indioceanicola profundi TaxID=2220096 RepID=UPI001CEC1909|nr:mechanosensitive ion channel domain-containing protein [Indioceanicola profundi]
MSSTTRALRAMLLLFPLLLLLLVPALPAWAQSAAPAPAATAAEPSAAELEELIATIEDEGRRKVLLGQLRTLLAAQAEGQAEEEETLGTRLLSELSERVEAFSGQISAAGRTLADAPRAATWLRNQISNPQQRQTWAGLMLALVVVVVAGYAARLIIMWLLRGPRRALGARDPSGWFTRILLLLLRAVMDLLPVAAFAVAGYGALSITDPPRVVRLAAITFLNASLVVQGVLVLARALVSPEQPNLRLLPVSDETAHYLVIWTRRIAVTAVYGYFLAQAALLLGLPRDAFNALLKLVGLAVTAMLVILVLQNRKHVADWLRGRRDGHTDNADDIALAAALSGEATVTEAAGPAAASPGTAPDLTPAEEGTGQRRSRALRAARRRLAEIWHVLAIVYIVAIYAIWALRIEGGFEYIVRATVTTLITLVAARYIGAAVDRLIRRGFAIAPELKAQHPRLEQRANRYLPILHRVLKGAIWVVAALVVLQAWGVDSFGWLGSPFGQRVSASLVSILLILVMALAAWEVVSGLIERYLSATDKQGKTVERSARMRTLLPLMRNAFLVLLSTLVVLTVLSEVGMDIAPLLAGAGVIGLAIGFGAQTLVKDVITGLFILIEDSISVGDVVNVGGIGGSVEAISIRSLRLRDMTGTVHTIPFSNVTNVANLTKDFSFYVFDVGVAYREDTDRVVDVLKQLGSELQADPAYGAVILEPLEIIGVDAFRDSAVIIKARFKTKPIKQWMVGREFNRRMKKRFDELGIEIPFPHQTVYFGTDRDGRAPAARVLLENADLSRTVTSAANQE